MGVLVLILTLITAFAYLLSAFRLACYQRDEKRYYWRGCLMTSLCGGVFCLSGIDLLLDGEPVTLREALISTMLCGLIIRCGGNVVVLWRCAK